MRYLFPILLLFATTVYAQQPAPDPLLGHRPGAWSARGLAIGHCILTTESGPAALLGNPALLAGQMTQWTADVTADLSRVTETRKYPTFDTFEGRLTYNNYAVNDHLYSKLDGGLAYRVPVGQDALVFSAGTYSLYRFDYRYHEEVRDRTSSGGVMDRKLGENRIDIEGDLRTFSLGGAYRTGELSLGASWSGLFGNWDYTRGVFYANPDSTNRVSRASYDPESLPMEVAVGLHYRVSERLGLALTSKLPVGEYSLKRTVTDETGSITTTDSTLDVTYPSRIGFGVSFQPQAEFRPLLMLEADLVGYSDFDDSYDDVIELRAGAEQEVVAGAPVRLGFVYGTAPSDKDRATTLFTAGIGFRLEKLAGDFGVEIGKINYTSQDLFPQSLYGDVDRIDRDRVETSTFRGIITLRYAL